MIEEAYLPYIYVLCVRVPRLINKLKRESLNCGIVP